MKRFLSILITVIFCISLLSIPAHADGRSFYLVTDKTSAEAGDIIAVTVMVSENSNVMGGYFEIDYDETLVEYTGTYADGNTGLMTSPNTNGIPNVGLMGMTAATGTTIYTFNFKVRENASGTAKFGLIVEEVMVSGSWSVTNDYTVGDAIGVKVSSFNTSTTIADGTDRVFTVQISGCPASGIIYGACYDGSGALVACDYEAFTSPITQATLTMAKEAYTEARVFVWDAFGAPLKGVELIEN